MLTKHLLTISLVLPLTVAAATAHAGSTITDKSYWPSEARQSVQTRIGDVRNDLNSALAYDSEVPRLRPLPIEDGGPAWRYHGGPKYQYSRERKDI
jgi:hypothetical protein